VQVVTIAPNGPQVTFSKPEWLNGKTRAMVIIGCNRYTEDGSNEEEATENLRNKLKELFAYSEQHKHMFK
jgi:hypothetical protein